MKCIESKSVGVVLLRLIMYYDGAVHSSKKPSHNLAWLMSLNIHVRQPYVINIGEKCRIEKELVLR